MINEITGSIRPIILGFKYFCFWQGVEYTFFSTSAFEVHQKIFKKLNFFPHVESIQKVIQGKYAYLYFKSNIQGVITRLYKDASQQSNIHWATKEAFSTRYTLGFPKVREFGISFSRNRLVRVKRIGC